VKVAVVHSFYRSGLPSGENEVVRRQCDALQEAGVEVLLAARYSDDEFRVPGAKVRAAFRVALGRGASPLEQLDRFQPDVVHVHNLFPNFGESWLDGWRGPIVATLHNYRRVCANGLFLRDGRNCLDCAGGNTWHAVRHGCYRDSRWASVPLAVHNMGGLARDRLVKRADAVVVPSDTAKRLLESAGLPSERTWVIANGLADVAIGGASRSGWASVGRYSVEKGLVPLLQGWPADTLTLRGDGPLRETLRRIAPTGVTVGPPASPREVAELMERSEGVIIASTAYEVMPTVMAEAFRSCTPVVVRCGGAAAAYVECHGGGVVYGESLQLEEALEECRRCWPVLAREARANFDRDFSIGVWTDRLKGVYRTVCERCP
jgi:glycosyltransferase involved in cell wall biosynthesis